MRDIFDIEIVFQDYAEVKTADKWVKIISFGGSCNSKYFRGKVLHGGTDVQVLESDGTGMVSARYILEGVDESGASCKVYVCNEGVIDVNGEMRTKPQVHTDSETLAWLSMEDLRCRFETREGIFHVIIYGE